MPTSSRSLILLSFGMQVATCRELESDDDDYDDDDKLDALNEQQQLSF